MLYQPAHSLQRCVFLLTTLLVSSLSVHPAHARSCAPLSLSEEVKKTGELSYVERAPTPDTPQSPLVIALHGLGHHKRGFSQLASRLPKTWRVISVDAPWRYGEGFAWYRYRCPEAEADLSYATERLLALVRALMKRYPSAPKPSVFGFSQGGVMSLSALNTAPELWASVGSLSGYWLPKHPPKPIRVDPPVLMIAHGERDRVVAFKRGEEAAQRFAEAGYVISWLSFTGGHSVDQRAFEALIYSFREGWRH